MYNDWIYRLKRFYDLFDSLLGATIERRGLVTNGIVNFAGTSFAGGLALALMV